MIESMKNVVRNRTIEAIRNGEIIRPEHCQKCGKECKPEAHHHDYKSHRSVVFLCRPCHLKAHRQMREWERRS